MLLECHCSPFPPTSLWQLLSQLSGQMLIHHPWLLTLEYLVPRNSFSLPMLGSLRLQFAPPVGPTLRISASLGLGGAQEFEFLTSSQVKLRLPVSQAPVEANSLPQTHVNRLISCRKVSPLPFFPLWTKASAEVSFFPSLLL